MCKVQNLICPTTLELHNSNKLILLLFTTQTKRFKINYLNLLKLLLLCMIIFQIMITKFLDDIIVTTTAIFSIAHTHTTTLHTTFLTFKTFLQLFWAIFSPRNMFLGTFLCCHVDLPGHVSINISLHVLCIIHINFQTRKRIVVQKMIYISNRTSW